VLLHSDTVQCYSAMLQYSAAYSATVQCYSTVLQYSATVQCYSTVLQFSVTVQCYSTVLQYRHVEYLKRYIKNTLIIFYKHYFILL
jgi:hypothetical protein